jgi:molybdopterin synthase catalytic subunit
MASNIQIRVQEADFDLGHEYKQLRDDNPSDGAIVTFVGLVRDINQQQVVTGLFLEHYPAMTEGALRGIVDLAKSKWPLGRVTVIHRVGQLDVSEQIVFVGVTSCHRKAAFDGAEFIMDYLKTQAPFWKKETTSEGDKWIQAKIEDQQKLEGWQ